MGTISPEVRRPPSLLPLTSLRFFAALGVVLYHLDLMKLSPRLGWIYKDYLVEGNVGVSFFFTLSGFVLAYNYRNRFRSLRLRELGSYAYSRFTRIYPLHLLTFLLVLVPTFRPIHWVIPDGRLLALNVVTQLTLTQAYVPDITYGVLTFNGVSWSLSVEVFFYMMLPWLLWLCCRRPVRHPAVLPAAAALVWVGQIIWTYQAARSGLPYSVWLWIVFPPGRFGEFVVGVLVGLAFANRQAAGGEPPVWRATAMEAFAVAVLVGQFALARAGWVPDNLRLVGYYTPAFCLILWVFGSQEGYLSALMSDSRLVFLGEASYALFMTHYLILSCMLRRMPQMAAANVEVFVVLVVVAAVAVSAFVHLFFEVPVRNMCMKWVRKPPAREVSLHPMSVSQAA